MPAAQSKPLAEREIIITRTFDAPRALVFKAWTDAKVLAQWWGPKGFSNPRCEFDAKVGGVIRIDERLFDVQGSAWYDHEFGCSEGSVRGLLSESSWSWLSAQLADGSDLTVFDIVDSGKSGREQHALLVGPDGSRRAFTGLSLEPLSAWTSSRTFQEYG